jgi:hypothetical protein
MTYNLNLANLPAAITVDFILWIVDNKIGNWEDLLGFIGTYEDWYLKEVVPFECTDREATLIILRWTSSTLGFRAQT